MEEGSAAMAEAARARGKKTLENRILEEAMDGKLEVDSEKVKWRTGPFIRSSVDFLVKRNERL